MPSRSKRPCLAQPCAGYAVERGRCAKHLALLPPPRRVYRGSAHSRGYGERHRRWRIMVLARDRLCVLCYARKRIATATVADHRVPLPRPNWWDGDWSIENGQGLCLPCHNTKTRGEQPPDLNLPRRSDRDRG
jgi:5-methylcytosine-specific restriction enzyme A